MSLKSRLLVAFATLSLVVAACATQQKSSPSTGATGTSTVEEVEEGTPGQQGAETAPPAGLALQTVGSPEDGFTARMPGSPQVVRNKVAIKAGEVVTAAWTANVEGVLYSLSTADYPVTVVAARPPEAFLNEGRDGLVNQLKGTLKNEEAITLEGYPGKSYTVSSDNGEVRARNFLVGPRLYTLLVLYNPSIGAPAADEFLKSLTLINPPPAVERKGSGGAATDGGTPGLDAGTAPDAGPRSTP